MNSNLLFQAALSIDSPWYIENIEFDAENKRLDININYEKGSEFSFNESGHEGKYKAYDTVTKTWRHLNFFEHECYLHCRTPRIKLDEHTIRLISPPWAGINSGFTLLFEALILQMCKHLPVRVVSRMIKETDNKLWRVLKKYVDSAREFADYSEVQKIGVDETSKSKGHDYISIFVDLEKRKTMFVTEGKDSKTVNKFNEDFKEHKGQTSNVTDVSCDMSPSFIKGVNENFPDAEITFDRFHIIKLINEAVDIIRRKESKSEDSLKGARYALLKNEKNLTVKQKSKLESLKISKLNLKSIRALRIREAFQEIYNAPDKQSFILLLKKWYFWATWKGIICR